MTAMTMVIANLIAVNDSTCMKNDTASTHPPSYCSRSLLFYANALFLKRMFLFLLLPLYTGYLYNNNKIRE